MPNIHRHRRAAIGVLAAALLATAGLAAPGTAQAAPTTGPTLSEALAALPVAEEQREGYDRGLFRHWVDEDKDKCNTRAEVLIAEAVMAPAVAEGCTITGGQWYSFYDDAYIDNARSLDIDHMVPLAEAWDSGAHSWDKAKRQAYANDLGDAVPLIAVTAKSNRSKSDKDPAEWMPPAEDAACRYAFEWVSVKTRWNLAVDTAEAEALEAIIADCPDATVTVTAP
ncbi:HNH endonuclease family protein [Glycomyces sp. A-F 0318]|uniref:HNH endonuclease family protein n=1 Tax=Glycomyces amatae TaxID=2881355 RepID=UPI001E3E2A01|nr:HNH endonuclease family protein [Glycomyces amatae]MCD0444224.1 HNH endonuclease family protein [Glycomyces amatae]